MTVTRHDLSLRMIQRELMGPLAMAILEGRCAPGDTATVDAGLDGTLVFSRAAGSEARSEEGDEEVLVGEVVEYGTKPDPPDARGGAAQRRPVFLHRDGVRHRSFQ